MNRKVRPMKTTSLIIPLKNGIFCLLAAALVLGVVQVGLGQHWRPDQNDANMSVLVEEGLINDQQMITNDEVGCFTPAGLCAGATTVNDDGFPIGIAAWGDRQDQQGINGFVNNEQIAFRLWDHRSRREIQADAEVVFGEAVYHRDDLVIVSLSGDLGEAIPAIYISDNPMDFGSVTVGESETLTIEVSSIGGETLIIESIESDNQNYHPPELGENHEIANGDSEEWDFVFAPEEFGDHQAVFTIRTNARNFPNGVITIEAQGRGMGSEIFLDANELEFGYVHIGYTRPRVTEVSNEGDQDLVIERIRSNNASFRYPDLEAGHTISPGSSEEWTFTYAPEAEGEEEATISILCNAANVANGSIDIHALGFGLSRTLRVPSLFQTIQSAIDASIDGDTVLVASGTYTENINFIGKDISVVGDPEDPSRVIIDGNGDRCVYFSNGETRSAILTGFTIQNGVANYGGAGGTSGGGIRCNNSSPTLSHLIVRNNRAEWGGGLDIDYDNSSPLVETLLFYGNQASVCGGAIMIYHCQPTLKHLTIFSNSDGNGGGAIFQQGSQVSLSNSIAYGNSPSQIGGNDGGPYDDGGTLDARFCDIQGGYNGNGNISSDPLFFDPDNGDFHLQVTSPCIDAGNPEAELDPDNTRADMGAYYVHQTFHYIALRQGWNLLSSFNQPRIAAMPTVWSEIVARGNLFMSKNQAGQFYMPGAFNNMAPWDVRQGYMAKLNEADTLVIVNVPTDVGTTIPLRQGWNMAAYFPEEELDVRDAFANIIDDLIIVKNIEGQFFIPARGFNNMALLRRGKGYQVNVAQAVELVYPAGQRRVASVTPPSRSASVTPPRVTANGKVSADDRASAEEVTHFQPVEMTGGNMSVLLTTLIPAKAGIQSDEIGAFTAKGLCVGSTGVSAGQTTTEGGATVIGLAVWADDPTTPEIDGAVEGEALGFRLWDGTSERILNTSVQQASLPVKTNRQEALPVMANRQAGTPVVRFEKDGFAMGEANLGGVLSPAVPASFAFHGAYPNPFNSSTIISYELPKVADLSLEVIDLQGRALTIVAKPHQLAGSYSVRWDAADFPAGVYILRLRAGEDASIRKVVLVR